MWFVSLAFAGSEPTSTAVPAAGHHEVVFDLPKFGRYAISARSGQGAAIQVVDAMAGPGARSGAIGAEDGRVDLFADRGRVKVWVDGDPAASGTATVTLSPYADATPTAPRLIPERRVDATLGDLQQRSYWLDLTDGQAVDIDVAARYLGDVRLWRDGSWLVDAEPRCAAVTPKPGQPWRRCTLSTLLEPGLYLLTVYGGPSAPWAQASTEAPMVLRWGAPTFGTAGRMSGAVGPAGYDLWALPEGPDTLWLALPDNAPAAVSWGASPLGGSGRVAITDESRTPTALLSMPARGRRYVVVEGAPGQTYDLTWFTQSRGSATVGVGEWYVTSLLAADPRDVLPPTAALVREPRPGQVVLARAQGLPLDGGHVVERTFNLAAATTTLLDVGAAGTYRFEVEGGTAQLLVRPYVSPSREVKSETVTDTIALDKALYTLELRPKGAPAIVTLRIAESSLFNQARRLVEGTTPARVRPAVSFPALDADAPLQLRLFGPAGVPLGAVVRALPLDPRDPVPVTLLPGESLSLPVRFEDAAVLFARSSQGKTVPVALDGGAPAQNVRGDYGDHTATVRNDGAEPLSLALLAVPERSLPSAPLPALDSARLAGLPKFPTVAEGRPLGLDLDRGESATMSLAVDGPGLYRVESTGLLSTSGAIRTRVTTRLADGSANGVGRNFLVAGYLRAGDYQVTVRTNGSSAGHCGVRLAKSPVADGGELPVDSEAHATVPAGAAVRYAFTVDADGVYALDQRGPSGSFSCRLEDADGWPIVTPGGGCGQTLRLRPGRYALVGLPTDIETRRVTTLRALVGEQAREGHGPFALTLGEAARHVWVETDPREGSAPDRAPDVWTASLAAEVTARIALSDEMTAELTSGGESLGRIAPGVPWRGTLPAGELQIAVRGARPGTGVPYTIELDTDELVAGASRAVSPPETIVVAVGAPGVYTLASAGDLDVRARLLDADGRVVAANDDRPDDWNFQISARLLPGRYELRIDPVASTPSGSSPPEHPLSSDTGGGGSDTGAATEEYVEGDGGGDTGAYDGGGYDGGEPAAPPLVVTMRAPTEVVGPPLKNGAAALTPGASAVLVPVDARGDVVVARVRSGENVGVAVEWKDGDTWRPLADATGHDAVAVARAGRGDTVRVRVWSEDVRGGPVELRVETPDARGVGADALAAGVGDGSGVHAVLAQGGAGQFAVDTDRDGLFACSTARSGCPPVRAPVVAGGADGLVLVRVDRPIRARRVVLRPDEVVQARLGAAPQALELAADPGPTVVEIRAPAGSPGAALPDGVTAAVPGAAITVSYGRAREASLQDGAGGPNELDARVTRRRVDPPRRDDGVDGRTRLALPPHGSIVIRLPGPRRAAVALDEGLVATFGDWGAAWADPGPVAAQVDAVEGTLGLLNPTDEPRYAVVDLYPAAAPQPLSPGHPAERLEVEAVTRLVPVAPADGVLRVRGAADARYRSVDGRVLPADGAPIGPGGVLTLRTQPGPVLAWAETGEVSGPLAIVRGRAPIELGASGVAALSGQAQRVRARLGAAAVGSLVVPCPVVAEIHSPGAPLRIEVLAAGQRLDLVAPEGNADVLLRALAGAELSGEAVLSSAPIVPIGEGLGPEALLGPGQAAFFSFRVPETRRVGVGVRANSGRVEATLLDARGVPRLGGVIGMDTLPAGTWLLAVHQAEGAPPARVRPAIVGLDAPPNTPPADVIRGYQQLARP